MVKITRAHGEPYIVNYHQFRVVPDGPVSAIETDTRNARQRYILVARDLVQLGGELPLDGQQRTSQR
jgi:hypothetical protein